MKSYITKEMNPKKFEPVVPIMDVIKQKYNRAATSFNSFTCDECLNRHDCPNDIKNYHNLEASISKQWSAPCWCMGTCGYRQFKIDWDLLLRD